MAGDRADEKAVSQIFNLVLQKLFWVVLNEHINISMLLLLPQAPMENRETVLRMTQGDLEE